MTINEQIQQSSVQKGWEKVKNPILFTNLNQVCCNNSLWDSEGKKKEKNNDKQDNSYVNTHTYYMQIYTR